MSRHQVESITILIAKRGNCEGGYYLAGGRGRRVCADVTGIPKPLVLLAGIPLVCHVINYMRASGVEECIVALGYMADIVREEMLKFYGDETSILKDDDTGEMRVCFSDSSFSICFVDTGVDVATGGRLLKIRRYLDNTAFVLGLVRWG